jgi:hypothetical protein
MFVVTEAEAAAIRAVYEQEGELSAAIEVRRLFPGITDNVQAREHARTIAGWPSASSPAPQAHPDVPYQIIDAVRRDLVRLTDDPSSEPGRSGLAFRLER